MIDLFIRVGFVRMIEPGFYSGYSGFFLFFFGHNKDISLVKLIISDKRLHTFVFPFFLGLNAYAEYGISSGIFQCQCGW